MLLWFSVQCFGQQTFSLKIESTEKLLLKIDEQILDSTEIKQSLHKLIEDKRRLGFLLANLDGLNFEGDTAYAKVYFGKKYDHIQLNNVDLPPKVLRGVGLKPNDSAVKVPIKKLESIFKQTIEYYQDNGYPFVKVRLDSVTNVGSQFSAKILKETGPLITFDSLKIEQSKLIKYQFLSSYLKIEYGAPYDQSKVDDINKKIGQLNYLKMNSEPVVGFKLGMGQVKIDISGRKVNMFDGIAGLLPGKNGEGNRLTGELKLSFDNLLKSGKKVDLEWQRLNSKSQFLDLSYQHPLLFHSPLNFSFDFNQLKEDTLFSNRSVKIGFNYNLSSALNLSIAFENENGNKLNSEIDDIGDFEINIYTLGLVWQKLDNLQFPKNGFQFKTTASIGDKDIASIANMAAEHNNSNQYEVSGQLAYYKQLSKRSVFHGKIVGGYLHNDQLFLNDLFRIGGLNTLRGFNEKLFFASEYALVNAELRWLVSNESYFLIFADQAVLNYDIVNGNFSENPTGVGFGFKIKTQTGYFNLIYGLGRTENQNFSFNFSKLHFGLTATL